MSFISMLWLGLRLEYAYVCFEYVFYETSFKMGLNYAFVELAYTNVTGIIG